jgi:intein/homing endonuclease
MQPTQDYTREDLFKQEYPCIVEGTLVNDGLGTTKIEDVKENYFVSKVINNGKKEAVEVITDKGYSIQCTPEHRIKTTNKGFVAAQNLTQGDNIVLSPMLFGKEIVTIEGEFLFSKLKIDITERLAEFIGIYMGDGDFYYKDGNGQSSSPSVGVACDRQCPDFIDYVCGLYEEFLGGFGQRFQE